MQYISGEALFGTDAGLMAAVELRALRKDYGAVTALDGVSLSIASGEFVTLLGPSGSGKTTLLNIVSGMIAPSRGAVLIDGADVTGVPSNARNLGMVFQNYALMPHMSVFENVAFPLRLRRRPRAEIERRVLEALEMVKLGAFAKRRPRELSGGQQQRVSIARCLVYRPKLVLMDEPLGALDKKLREQLQLEIKKIHRELGVTILYVTHDQEEALVLSDRVCVMNEARIEQVGSPHELYFRPQTPFVAGFLGESNLIEGRIVALDGAAATVESALGAMAGVPLARPAEAGQEVRLLIRPECLALSAEGPPETAGRLEHRIFVGEGVKAFIDLKGVKLVARTSSRDAALAGAAGDALHVAWRAADALAIPIPRTARSA